MTQQGTHNSPGPPDNGMSKAALSIPGLITSVFRDAHFPAHFERALSKRRGVDNGTRTTFDLMEKMEIIKIMVV